MEQTERILDDNATATPMRPRLLSQASSAAIRHALRDDGNDRAMEAGLRHAACAVCDDARARGLRVEQMLVALKDEWAAHPDVRRLPHGRGRADLTARFITLCIHEFFAADASRPADGDGDGDGASPRDGG